MSLPLFSSQILLSDFILCCLFSHNLAEKKKPTLEDKSNWVRLFKSGYVLQPAADDSTQKPDRHLEVKYRIKLSHSPMFRVGVEGRGIFDPLPPPHCTESHLNSEVVLVTGGDGLHLRPSHQTPTSNPRIHPSVAPGVAWGGAQWS